MSPDALVIGPLVLSWGVLLALAAAWVGHGLAGWLARRGQVELGRDAAMAVLLAFVGARLAFAWEFRGGYLAEPWRLLDIRDGGWSPLVGLGVAWLYGLSRMSQRPERRAPLRAGLAAGTALWLAGSALLLWLAPAGQRLPPLALPSAEAAERRLDAFAGRPVVMNLWATWCPPCVREMPVLARAQRERPEVHIVFVNQGEPPERVRAWLAGRGLVLDNLLFDRRGQVSAAFDTAALPTTLFFDAEGRLVSRRVGELSEASLAQQLERLRR